MSKIVTNQISPRSGDTVTVTEKLNVQGVLTYEDVTNIDSVGIITAQSGIKVLADGINAVGVVTATTFSGNTIGTAATFTDSAKIGTSASSALSDRVLSVGDVSRSATYVEVRTSTSGASGVVFSDGVDSSDTGYRGTIEYAHSSDQLTFKAGGVTRVTIDGTGNMGATGNVSDSIGPLRRLGQNIQSGNYTLVASDAGKHIRVDGNHTIEVPDNVFTAGDMITIVANSASNVPITQGSGLTLYNASDGTTGSKTQAARTVSTILFAEGGSGAKAYISGGGLS